MFKVKLNFLIFLLKSALKLFYLLYSFIRIGDENTNSKTLGFDLQIEINYGINEELDFLRNSFYQLDDFLESYAKNEMLKYQLKF